MKRLKNIENKNEEQLNNQLQLVKNNSLDRESLNKLKFLGTTSQSSEEKYSEIKKIDSEIKKIDSEIDYNKLVCVHTNGKIYNFIIFRRLANLARSLIFGDIPIKQAKDRQDEMESLLSSLSRYNLQSERKGRNS